VFLGVDPVTHERLYDLHPRRAKTCSLRNAVTIFRASEYAGKLGAGVVGGRRQLGEAKCACVKERKASECDCEQCTQVTLSLGRFNLARHGWHKAFAATNGSKGCSCPLHDYSPQAAAASKAEASASTAAIEAAARRADSLVWTNYAPGLSAAVAADAEAVKAEAEAAKLEEVAVKARSELAVACRRVERYASMTASEDALMAALLPCGKKEYPEQTVTGEKLFKCYSKACCEDNCPKRTQLFERCRGSACGYELVFEGHVCPVDNSTDEMVWQRWEKMQGSQPLNNNKYKNVRNLLR